MALVSPEKFEKQFESLYKMLNMTLEEMSTSFVNYKLGTEKQQYVKDQQQFNSTLAKLFKQEQLLLSSTDKANNQLTKYNNQITNLNKNNNNLLSNVSGIDNITLAAQGELKLQQTLYKELHIQNIILICVSIFSMGFFVKNYHSSHTN